MIDKIFYVDKFTEERIKLLEYHKLLYLKDIKLISIIGQGQFGLVYKGILKDNEIEREVAVKTISRCKMINLLIEQLYFYIFS